MAQSLLFFVFVNKQSNAICVIYNLSVNIFNTGSTLKEFKFKIFFNMMFMWEKPQIHIKDFKFMSISYQFNSSFFCQTRLNCKSKTKFYTKKLEYTCMYYNSLSCSYSSSHGQVKLKIIKLVIAASLLSMQH